MRSLRAWLVRLAGSLARERRDREMAAELDSHLQMHIDDNVRAGMTPEEARREALVKLGGLEQAKERYRDRSRLPALETALQDLRFAARLLRRAPGFTIVAIITLALGIGANTVMFGVVNTLLLQPLPYRNPERLLFVQTLGASRQPWGTSPPDFYEYRRESRTLDHLDAFYVRALNITGGEEPERVSALAVSPTFFTTLGVQPVLGRGFLPQDEQWGSHRVVVLGNPLWKRRYGGDPGIVGRAVTINSESYLVIGVMPENFSFLAIDASLVVPMSFEPGDNMNSHSNYFLSMVGRLGPSRTRAEALAELNRLSAAIIARAPENTGTSIAVEPLRDALVGDVRRPVLVLLGAVAFVLLIACANLANLLLARGAVRTREIVVRMAIGATRGRLLRQFLTESVLLAALGGAAGLALAYLSVRTLDAVSPAVLPRPRDIRIDRVVLAFTSTAALITGVLVGLLPAIRGSLVEVNEGLKDGARGMSDRRGRSRLRAALVVSEVALSLVLLAGAGLMVKSMHRLLSVDAGFTSEGVLTMQINLPAQKYVDRDLERQFSSLAYERSAGFFTDLIERVRRLPGVRAAGAINGLPLMGEIWGKNITFYDRPLPAHLRDLPPIQYRVVAGDYFNALGIRVLSGRAFADTDTRSSPRVAIVNRELVRRYWNGEDPVGKVISVNPPLELVPDEVLAAARRAGMPADFQVEKFTVIGVAADVRYRRLSSPPLPVVYTPYAQGSEGTTDMYLTVRTDGDPLAFVGAIREQIRQIDKDQPVAGIRTLDDRVSASAARPRLQTIVLGVFAMLALVLATVGIYGVTSYAVTQRTREIGIRMALGATRRDVLDLIVRQGATMMLAGVAVGLPTAMLTTTVLRALLFEVRPADPQVLASIVVVLAATGCAATYLPARRATRIDPIAALRDE